MRENTKSVVLFCIGDKELKISREIKEPLGDMYVIGVLRLKCPRWGPETICEIVI